MSTDEHAVSEEVVTVEVPNDEAKRLSENLSRVTYVSELYYQRPKRDPDHFSLKSVRWIDSDEEVYSREMKLPASQPKILDLGWLDDSPIDQVVVENVFGRFRDKVPTETEERDERASRRILVGYRNACPFAEIVPGDHLRISLLTYNDLYLLSERDGLARIVVVPGDNRG